MKRKIAILTSSVAVCALCLVTGPVAFARGGGGGGFGGGHGFAGAGGGHGFGGLGGGHGFAGFGGGHGFGGIGGAHGFAGFRGGHGFGGPHGLGGFHAGGPRFATHPGGTAHLGRASSHAGGHAGRHNVAHLNQGHAGRIGTRGLAQGHNALATHNEMRGANQARGQFAHNQIAHNQFAHNQFAAQNFHGLNNFNKAGFNRNAFGNHNDWNHWGGNFWGAGWDHWGGGWGGWAGPVFWPFVLGDVFTFVLWPYGYWDPFWAFGIDFILASIFAPGPYFGIEYGYGPDYYDYGYGPDYYGYAGVPNIYYDSYRSGSGQHFATTRTADRQALTETNTEAMQSCSGLAPGVTNLPIEEIRQKIRATADQQAALGDLSAAMSQASDIIKSSCPTSVPLTPIGRLDTADQRLEATIKAVQVVRAPLERFYDLLSDEQKREFNAMGGAEPAASVGNMAALCTQQGEGIVNLPVQRIEQVVRPDTQQRSAFDNLKKAAQTAADQLQSSCPTAIPQSPVARLESVDARLNSIAEAIRSIRPALGDFYASLNDEQKARFNTMGPPPETASSQPESQGGTH